MNLVRQRNPCFGKLSSIDDIRVPMEGLTMTNTNDSGQYSGCGHFSFCPSDDTPSSGRSHGDSTITTSTHSSGYMHEFTDTESSRSYQPRLQRRLSLDTVDTNLTVELDVSYFDKFPKLVDLERVPWGETELLNILREGRTKYYGNHITVEIMQKLGYLLQRPLTRISYEAQRLSQCHSRCGKEEIISSINIVLAHSLAHSCLQGALKANAMFSMSGDTFKTSKSHRCGLRFSIGKFHRWMIDAMVAPRVHESAAIFLTACMETLVEEIVLMSFHKDLLETGNPFTLSQLDSGIAAHPELWGLLQPYQHLVCGRTGSGLLTLPNSMNFGKPSKVKGRRIERENEEDDAKKSPFVKNIEQTLLATCVGSMTELGDLVSKALHFRHMSTQNSWGLPGKPTTPLMWSLGALHGLYHYMRCGQLEHADNPSITPPSVHLHSERPFAILPPLIDWVRVTSAHADYRRSLVVDKDDLHQAARLLLPGLDSPPRDIGTDESACSSRDLDSNKCALRFQQDLAFRMLACGRSDILTHATALLGSQGINTMNDQGLTPLMLACARGDEAMVQLLIDSNADLDMPVPIDLQKYPAVHPDTRHWTALTFAASKGHMSIVQLLLEQGASVEGATYPDEDNHTETPLQLASAAGDYDMVSLLLNRKADPYLSTIHRSGLSYTYSRGGHSALAMAATHGHRNVLRQLLKAPVCPGSSSGLLTLEEILDEGRMDSLHRKYNHVQDIKVHLDFDEREHENEYVTIDDIQYEDSKLQGGGENFIAMHRMSKGQQRAIQESLFHAAENGFLDIALELRNMGVPWSLYTWGQCLQAAYNTRRKKIIQCLLRDFHNSLPELYSEPSIHEDVLTLLFEVLRNVKNETISQQITEIFQLFHGYQAMPEIFELKPLSTSRIDGAYVNNPELSDVQFLVEGKLFYAHKIILVNASKRFRNMLSLHFSKSSTPTIEVADVKFHIFQYMMEYLYCGDGSKVNVAPTDIMELLASAHYFMLDGLVRHCEVLCLPHIKFENCVPIYRHAQMYAASELVNYCKAFFLRNMPELVQHNEEFRRLLFSSKSKGWTLMEGLLSTILDSIQHNQYTETNIPSPKK